MDGERRPSQSFHVHVVCSPYEPVFRQMHRHGKNTPGNQTAAIRHENDTPTNRTEKNEFLHLQFWRNTFIFNICILLQHTKIGKQIGLSFIEINYKYIMVSKDRGRVRILPLTCGQSFWRKPSRNEKFFIFSWGRQEISSYGLGGDPLDPPFFQAGGDPPDPSLSMLA